MNTMLSMRLISRGNLPQYAATAQRLHTSSITLDSSSSSDSDKASSKKKVASRPAKSQEEKQKEQEGTTRRLNDLLAQMIKPPRVPKPMDLSVPLRKPRQAVKPKTYEKKVIEAAKDVANVLGGDVEKTESALLNKLLSLEEMKSSEKREKVASSSMSLKELLSGMRVEQSRPDSRIPPQQMNRSKPSQYMSRKFQPRQWNNDGHEWKTRIDEHVDLYDVKRLNIFRKKEAGVESVEGPKLPTWERLEKKEFKLSLSHPPENYFQEQIQWTEEGKLWKFPIDNEQGLEEEQSVHFSEHVFMERHLRDWCPKAGPIRHFMELVCVGLSKNPYMTVNEKLTHIRWYQEFFGSKQELLKEIGAIDQDIPKVKQLEAQ